jgi:dTDP-4-dehydrorhamnose reductase
VLDAEETSEPELIRLLEGIEWVVNAIGVIKPYIREDEAVSLHRAIRVNSLFPTVLARAAEQCGCHVLQIATDCVYSGTSGGYFEIAPHDALDVYGKTKSLGEVPSPVMHHLRCSIIGPEPRAQVSLLEWFLKQPRHSVLNGFANHLWNGVTTLHFARLCLAAMSCEGPLPHVQHVVPSASVTKKELLDCLALEYGRADVTINTVDAAVAIDRTLATANETLNQELWQLAGYEVPPTVAQMVAELAVSATRDGIAG